MASVVRLRPNNNIKKRLVVFLLLFTCVFIAIIVRVAYIQIISADFLQKKAFEQQTRDKLISPRRGTIYDRNYKELAKSASAETISVNPKQIKDFQKDFISQRLSVILDMEAQTILTKLSKKNPYELIKKKVEKDVGNKVRSFIKENKIQGIAIDEDYKRYYTKRNLASQVIGFTGSDNQGLSGIELFMEKYLKGTSGKILSEVDVRGNELPFKEERRIDAKDGLNVVLTIDETIQYFAQRALEKAIIDNNVVNGGSVIVMDPKNGDILAMVSKPDFDPNDRFAKPAMSMFDSMKWDPTSKETIDVLQKNVWRNRAISDSYEPGSTFKAVTSAIGFEENVINEETPVNDFTITVGGRNINCWKPNGHGNETFKEGVYNSCNPVFVKLAQLVGVDVFYKYMKAFGFYDKTKIELPLEGNSIIHVKPTEVDMAVASFGQRFQITPLQMITSYAAIANGGKLMKPRIMKELTDNEGTVVKRYEPEVVRNVISKETSSRLRTVLEGVVTKGTGKNAYVRGFKVAGKTGTSETTESGRYIASFSAFAPSDNPSICVLVVLDNPKGSSHAGGVCAAPVAGKIIDDTLSYLGIERRSSDPNMESVVPEVEVPEVRNKSITEAKDILTKAGLVVKIEGSTEKTDSFVMEQTPKPYASLTKNSVIILYTQKPEKEVVVKVPDIKQKTVNEVLSILNKVGLNLKVLGSGLSVSQSVQSGIEVEKGRIITVEFVEDLGD